MSHIDIFPKKDSCEKFLNDFLKTFLKDIMASAKSRKVEFNQIQLITLINICLDRRNKIFLQCWEQHLFAHCIRIAMEVLPNKAIKFSFKAFDENLEQLLPKKVCDALMLFPGPKDREKARKDSKYKSVIEMNLPNKPPPGN